MESAFPFGFPFATGFYLFWMVLTLAIHVVFMNYVLAGTGYLAVAAIRNGKRGGSESREVERLKSWLPLMLSGAITAGVAPLLFVQILYQKPFYTANVLLFNHWMSILPVLIVGFYGLYLVQSGWLHRRSAWLVASASAVPFLCVAYTGHAWTENHLLSMRTSEEWATFYATESQVWYEPQLIPRLLVWAFGSVATMATLLAWQLRYLDRFRTAEEKSDLRPLARLAFAGIAATGVVAAVYALAAGPAVRAVFTGPMALPFFALALLGLSLQVFGWWNVWREKAKGLLFASGGLGGTIAGMTACRECVRIETYGAQRFAAQFSRHAEAIQVSGFGFFLAFFLINAVLIGIVFRIVRTQKKPQE